ncbi:MAG: hypothetical protein OXR68_01460 [Alphaproteobacteria bacterium]|nr:hypothetical protein [Alphaproteobacteria bacterium]MDD9919279.1 hypothetical protein [Alphaproteobacteria bacterium]
MFTSLLFDHVFDIDDVITALCGDHHTGRWVLNSREGSLTAEDADASSTLKDGDDDGHIHIIEPLPLSFLEQLKTHPKLAHTAEDTQQEILQKLSDAKSLHALLQASHESLADGWIRERMKDVALDWLDARGMIPPSMRHVREDNLFGNSPSATEIKVNIS